MAGIVIYDNDRKHEVLEVLIVQGDNDRNA